MHGFWQLTWTDLRLFLREPGALAFTWGVPIALLVLNGVMWGNAPNPLYEGLGAVDASVPLFSSLIIASNGLMTIGVVLATYREAGILRRLKATPVRPWMILLSELTVVFALTIAGMLAVGLVAVLFFGLRMPGRPLDVAAAFTLGSACFFAIGLSIASLVRSARSVHAIGMLLFYPMMLLCGAAVLPLELMPLDVQQFAGWLPLTSVVKLMRGMWAGDPWARHLGDVGLLVGVAVTGFGIGVRRFRWE